MAELKKKEQAQETGKAQPQAVATHVQVTVKVPNAKSMVVTVPVGSTVSEALAAAGVKERPGYELYVDNKLASMGSALTKDAVVAYVAQVVGGR